MCNERIDKDGNLLFTCSECHTEELVEDKRQGEFGGDICQSCFDNEQSHIAELMQGQRGFMQP